MPAFRERAILRGHLDVVRSVSFSRDGSRLVSTGQDRLVLLWDAADGELVRRIGESGSTPVQFASYSPDGQTIAVCEPGCSEPDILMYDAETGVQVSRLKGHGLGINAVSFAPDGRTLASAGNDGDIKLWDLTLASEVSKLSADAGQVKSIAFPPDGLWLAFVCQDATVRIRDLKKRISRQIESPASVPTRIGKSLRPHAALVAGEGV